MLGECGRSCTKRSVDREPLSYTSLLSLSIANEDVLLAHRKFIMAARVQV